MRPTKSRTISHIPECRLFHPSMENDENMHADAVTIGLDMLEAMRLVDLEGLSQEDAASSMEISTPTLCRILSEGRKLTATALAFGKTINLEGGNIMFSNENHGRNGCCRRRGNMHCKEDMQMPDASCMRRNGMKQAHGKGRGGFGCMGRSNGRGPHAWQESAADENGPVNPENAE